MNLKTYRLSCNNYLKLLFRVSYNIPYIILWFPFLPDMSFGLLALRFLRGKFSLIRSIGVHC